jgi:arsenical pump membrane protein
VHEVIALLALAAALTAAIARPSWAPESVVALVGAAACLAAGALSWADATAEARAVAPTLALLAALLALGDGCRRAGVFSAVADRLARGARGSPPRLLALVFGAAASTTALLGLDATVVLLTPAVLAAAARLRMSPRPHLYACTHLANSASLVLPVSNLTNLLAFRATGTSFAGFAALMAAPWLVALAIEWAVLRRWFARQLDGATAPLTGDLRRLPRLPLAVLALTLAGFVAASARGIDLAWPAALGALALALPGLRGAHGPRAAAGLVRAVDVPLLAFVLGLAVIVRAVSVGPVGARLTELLPAGAGLAALLGTAALAAALANRVNNLPALLLLLPAAAAAGRGPVLAALVGVNAGPNLTYVGSLATVLWRRIVRRDGEEPPASEFLRLGALSVPAVLVGATVALWLVLQVG